jgi:hypothetical protein
MTELDRPRLSLWQLQRLVIRRKLARLALWLEKRLNAYADRVRRETPPLN